MSNEIKRATGLLIIEVVNSNANGDPDRESDPRQRPNGIGEISPVSFKRITTAFSSKAFLKSIPKTQTITGYWSRAAVKGKPSIMKWRKTSSPSIKKNF